VLRSCLGPFEDVIFEQARKEGRLEERQAYTLDALLAMAVASGSGSGPASADPDDSEATDDSEADDPESEADDSASDHSDHPSTKATTCKRCKNRSLDPEPLVRVRVDGEALLRGYAEDGETCEIPGLGQVPVALARSFIGDAILQLVVTRGTDVTTVVSDSRYVRKALRIALEERDKTCVVPGCHMSDPLERDHWQVDYAKNGPTELDNLARLCGFHHRLRTHEGWELFGPPGRWRFEKPTQADNPPDAGDPVTESRANDPPGEQELF
jgi:hypothetical protein